MQEIQEMWMWSLGREDPLEKEMATHSSILAYKIPQTEEPGGLQSLGLQSQARLSMHNFRINLKLWSLVGSHLWGCTELDTTEAT